MDKKRQMARRLMGEVIFVFQQINLYPSIAWGNLGVFVDSFHSSVMMSSHAEKKEGHRKGTLTPFPISIQQVGCCCCYLLSSSCKKAFGMLMK
jgi:hypothetical protein